MDWREVDHDPNEDIQHGACPNEWEIIVLFNYSLGMFHWRVGLGIGTTTIANCTNTSHNYICICPCSLDEEDNYKASKNCWQLTPCSASLFPLNAPISHQFTAYHSWAFPTQNSFCNIKKKFQELEGQISNSITQCTILLNLAWVF